MQLVSIYSPFYYQWSVVSVFFFLCQQAEKVRQPRTSLAILESDVWESSSITEDLSAFEIFLSGSLYSNASVTLLVMQSWNTSYEQTSTNDEITVA